MSTPINITTNAVIITVRDGVPWVRVVDKEGQPALPSGALDDEDRTITESIRRWVKSETDLDIGYVEQLYTFGDSDRVNSSSDERLLSIAYLALADTGAIYPDDEPWNSAGWLSIYDLFPWEDERESGAKLLRTDLATRLAGFVESADAHEQEARLERVRILFPDSAGLFDGVRALERYELMYEAGLLAEAGEPGQTGTAMYLDHRRICATALARIRGKLTYRPVVFELLPHNFTLLELQQIVEALLGTSLHKQNFRRQVDTQGLVEGTGEQATPPGGGRPAELFQFRREVLLERPRPGIK